MFSWSFDTTTGVIKDHAISKRVLVAAIAETVFMEHMTEVDGYGAKKGQSVTIPRFSNITELTDDSIDEMDWIPTTTVGTSARQITVGEHGRAIDYSSLATTLSPYDLEKYLEMKLRDDMKLSLDRRACRAFKNDGKACYTPTGAAAASTSTNGTMPTAALSNMNMYHLGAVRDLLWVTYKAEMIGNTYVGIFHDFALRGIKNDPDFKDVYKYTDPSKAYNSEVGQLEQIRCVSTNHVGSGVTDTGALSLVGTSSCLGEGLVFGKDAAYVAWAKMPEIRADNPRDLGRKLRLGWWGIYEMALGWNTANAGENKVIRIGSST